MGGNPGTKAGKDGGGSIKGRTTLLQVTFQGLKTLFHLLLPDG
jgi:hypothetical protein